MTQPDASFEIAARAKGFHTIAGLDEVGRGPLAGPVVACAVVLDPARIPAGLNDSKKMTLKARERLHDILMAEADVGIGICTVEEIDSLNILRASHLAMERAVALLKTPADYALVDGNLIPKGLTIPAEALVKGDARSVSIAAASIVAKVVRDRIMVELSQAYPHYGWAKNAGYPTKIHREGLESHGVTPHHRRSFAPIHKMLYQA